ncbi:MAG: T9SS type A sorting domain-containing protein [Bacteroidetes bacterium]|nr:T9SS type A sorting domain-containing protein [Bacteroidota bacterium]
MGHNISIILSSYHFFPSNSTGYCGGHDDKIYKTTDLGDSWSYTNNMCCSDFSNFYFFNDTSGIKVYWGGGVANTQDGCQTWNWDTVIGGYSPYPGLGSIQFINDSIGIIAAGQFGTYARTTNQGSSWRIGHIDSSMNVFSIFMKNQNEVYAVGANGKYSRSYDGGQTWTTPIQIIQYSLFDIAFFTDSIGYAVGGSFGAYQVPYARGIIMKTIDGGNNWFVADSSHMGTLSSIEVVTSSIGFAAGARGLILKTVNANSTGINNNLSSVNNFSVHPNITQGIIKVYYGENSNTKNKLTIFNSIGSIVNSSEILSGETIDLSNYSNGIYIYEFINDNSFTHRGKIIKTN